MPRNSPYSIQLDAQERSQLEALARKYPAPYHEVVRAKMVLLACDGLSNTELAARLDLPRQIVSKWRKRYFPQRTRGLQDQLRTGRPSTFSPSDPD